MDKLDESLEEHRPDVMLFGCSDPGECPAPQFMRCLREGRVQKIICVNLQDDAVFVFRAERVVVKQVEDLFGALSCEGSGSVTNSTGCAASSPG
jgi:hypothetical protein